MAKNHNGVIGLLPFLKERGLVDFLGVPQINIGRFMRIDHSLRIFEGRHRRVVQPDYEPDAWVKEIEEVD